MGRLEGRVAAVTGTAQGSGAAFARALAPDGARIAVADLDSNASVVGEINGGALE